jgi:hypothetical protein
VKVFSADLLLELLVNGIECVFYRHALQVSCSDFETQWEVQVNLLDGRRGEWFLED